MIDAGAIAALFNDARSQNGWLDKPVSDDELRRIYDLAKMGPTASNGQPMRLVFVRTKEGKERLRPALSAGNVDKTMAAPVCVIVANDIDFHEKMTKTFAHAPQMKANFDGDAKRALREGAAMRNGSLGGGYLIMAVRATGLDVGPMSGFDNAKVDAEFFAGTALRSNFLCNIGHGDPAKVMPRLPRLDFDEACRLL